MLRAILIPCLLLFLFGKLYPQNHDYVWLFGYAAYSPDTLFGGSVIDFNKEPPLVYEKDRDMNIFVTMASVCDSSGILQFYSNGISVQDTTDQLMVNGDSLNPGEYADSYQNFGYPLIMSEIVLPFSGQPSKYAILHLKIEDHPIYTLAVTTLYMTIVDMSLNNGLGEVVSKNQVLLSDGRYGTINAVKHANGRDWWIWVAYERENKYQRFLFSEGELVGPEQIDAEPSYCCPNSVGTIVFSPDGLKAARYNVAYKLFVYDHDRCSGELSNPKAVSLPNSNLGGGVAFSQNSRFLYIAYDAENIYQYDTWADNMAVSKVTVATYDGFLGYYGTRSSFLMLQLGPDGRIYITAPNSIEVLSYIDQPDRPGLDCRVVQHGLHLPNMNGFTCPHYPNYRLGPLDGSPCDTLGLDNQPVAKYRCYQDTSDYLTVEFTDLSTYAPTDWAWDFGDGTVSQDTSPVHTFPGGGTYEVCLTVSNPYSSDTFCKMLQLGPSATEGRPVPQAEISVFPNPAQSFTNVRLGGDYLPRNARFTLYAATGQPVHMQRVTAGWGTVPLEGLAPGIYFWEVMDEGRRLGGGKLVRVE
ncbi:MAG: PKD domain-containing protein [Saprospiraceae bacterium]|nr:PKD domain-containing protein [Saprospiraceae bacterium]